MNKLIMDMIQKLSKADKKKLSEKTLKLMEEAGELAKAVLPYSGAYATKKKFVNKEKILEEVADVLLCAYSVAYELDFSLEDIEAMVQEKSLVWADLQNREKFLDELLPFEIHVTVSNVDKEEFKKVCAILGIKPIILDLQNTDGKTVFEDVMSSSIFLGSNATVYNELKRISNSFKRAGFNVVREKIETVPWHPAAPSNTHKNPIMPKNCYFECHFNVVCDNLSLMNLKQIAKDHECHLSKNIYKKIDNDFFKIMMTYRKYDGVKETFLDNCDKIERKIMESGFGLDKKIIEFSIFDTKVSHDSKWLQKEKKES